MTRYCPPATTSPQQAAIQRHPSTSKLKQYKSLRKFRLLCQAQRVLSGSHAGWASGFGSGFGEVVETLTDVDLHIHVWSELTDWRPPVAGKVDDHQKSIYANICALVTVLSNGCGILFPCPRPRHYHVTYGTIWKISIIYAYMHGPLLTPRIFAGWALIRASKKDLLSRLAPELCRTSLTQSRDICSSGHPAGHGEYDMIRCRKNSSCCFKTSQIKDVCKDPSKRSGRCMQRYPNSLQILHSFHFCIPFAFGMEDS